MAKLLKVTAYLLDIDEQYTLSDIKEEMRNSLEDIIVKNVVMDKRDVGEWHDEHPLNYYDSPITECEKYFEEK